MDILPSLTVDHTRFTPPSSTPAMLHDHRNNMLCQERLLLPIKKRCFATAFEDKYDHQQVKKFNQEGYFLPIKKRCFVIFQDDQQVKKLTENAIIKKREGVLPMEKKKKSRKMPKKMESGPVVNSDSTDQLKRFITGEMFGLDMKLVIQKPLYESDLNKTQNRLNMPVKQLVTRPHEFLTDDEMRVINEDGMEVKVVGPTMKMYEKPLRLKTWHMKNTDNYVLKTSWNEFVACNKMVLKTYTVIQVWSFRKDRELCFAIVPVERPEGEKSGV